MIKRIRIKLFQAHEDTTLDLHPGINIITGIGDSGKTAIKRAVEWAKDNRPAGNRFRSDFADGVTQCEVVFDDGTLSLAKGKAGAVYTVDGQEFRKFKSAVPEAVPALMRLTNINFQGQFDKPFLLTMTKGKLAQMFNRVASLDAAAGWLDDLAARRTQQQAVLANAEDLLSKAEAAAERYSRFGELEALVTSSRDHHDAYLRKKADADAAHLVYGRVRNRLDRLARLQAVTPATKLAGTAAKEHELARGLIEVALALEALKRRQERHRSVRKAVIEAEALRKKAAGSDAAAELALTKAKDLGRLKAKRDRLRAVAEEKAALAADYKASMEAMGRCPTCFQTVDAETIEREVRKYD